ncbi:uncharacterized protein ACO6RY_12817 [Pungitius sinensis]
MYTSQNATPCDAGSCYCQMTRQMDMWYKVGCSATCAPRCTNTSQTNCSMECCSSTDCLDGYFASMMMTTTGEQTHPQGPHLETLAIVLS